MAGGNDVTLNLRITGDGKDGSAAIQQVVEGLRKLGVQAQQAGKEVGKGGEGFKELTNTAKEAIKELAGALGLALGVKEFLELGHASLENAKALNELSQEVGISIETLSVLQLEARKMNLDTQNLSVSLRGLSNSLKQVQQGNVQTIEAFRSLGLDGQKLVKIASGPGGLEAVFFDVANALVKFSDGANKNAVVQDLLGGRATKLIPLMQSLAGDGFARASTEAERLGAILRESDVRAAEEFEASIVSLQQQATALSRSFFEGLIPGVTTTISALDDMTGSTAGARSGFESLGGAVGAVVKFIAFVFNEAAKTVSNITFIITRNVEGVAGALAEITSGNLTGALNELKTADTEIRAFRAQGEQDSAELWKRLFGKPEDVKGAADEARTAAINELNTTVNQLKRLGKTVEGIDVTKLTTAQIIAKTKELNGQIKQQIQIAAADQQQIFKAQSDARLAALDRELAATKERTSQFVAAASASFDQGNSSLAQFFAARRQALETEGNAEIAAAKAKVTELETALARQRGIRANGPEAIQLETDLANARNQVDLLGVQIQGRRNALTVEEAAKRKDLNNAALDFQKALAEAQGRTFQAALIGIDQQVEAFRIQLAQIGVTGEEAARQLKAFRDAASSKAQLDELSTQASRISQAISENESRLKQQVDAGLISQNEATVRQNRFVSAQTGSIEAIRQSFETLKTATSDPNLISAIDEQIAKLNELGEGAKQAQSQIQLFGQGALQAGGRSLLTFFGDLSDGAHTIGEAFGDMARSFITAIAQMIQQILALEAITIVAKALGVPVPSGGFQFASGGAVPGQGSGDTVRAMLTPGEFVLNRRMVAYMGGLTNLERLRLSLAGHGPLTRGGVSFFAGGGIVPGVAGAGALNPSDQGQDVTRVIIEAHPDLVVRQIESGAGSRAVVKAMKNNRHAANDALGRPK